MKKIMIGKSKIAGRGIIAAEDIERGEFIWPLRGRTAFRKYRHKSDYRNEQTWIPIAIHRWVNPAFPFMYLNHSCEPSAGFKTPRRLYAMRNIRKGEEITVDYSTIEYVDFWHIPCKCGSKHCRRIIRSVHFLSKNRYHSYLPYIPRFIQKVYGRRNLALK